MSDPYYGEIRIFAGNYAPENWAICDGRLLQISEYSPLFALIGTTYGGDGVRTFAIPDLRGRLPIHMGQYSAQNDTPVTYTIGSAAGTETVTVTTAQMPAHTHVANGQSANGTQPGPAGGVWAAPGGKFQYLDNLTGATMKTMDPDLIANAGGSQPHNNVMPYLAMNYIIALQGYWPDRP